MTHPGEANGMGRFLYRDVISRLNTVLYHGVIRLISTIPYTNPSFVSKPLRFGTTSWLDSTQQKARVHRGRGPTDYLLCHLSRLPHAAEILVAVCRPVV